MSVSTFEGTDFNRNEDCREVNTTMSCLALDLAVEDRLSRRRSHLVGWDDRDGNSKNRGTRGTD